MSSSARTCPRIRSVVVGVAEDALRDGREARVRERAALRLHLPQRGAGLEVGHAQERAAGGHVREEQQQPGHVEQRQGSQNFSSSVRSKRSTIPWDVRASRLVRDEAALRLAVVPDVYMSTATSRRRTARRRRCTSSIGTGGRDVERGPIEVALRGRAPSMIRWRRSGGGSTVARSITGTKSTYSETRLVVTIATTSASRRT